MRFRQPNFELMEADSLQVDPKEVQQLNKIEPVPRIGNVELRTTFGLCDLPAVFFDLARRNPKMSANRLKSFSGVQLIVAYLLL